MTRLALRILLMSMRACETALDEIGMKSLGGHHHATIREAFKSQQATRKRISAVLDSMMDSGEGD